MKKVLYIDGNSLSHHYTTLSHMWHGEYECVYTCATSEMTQIMKKLAVEWIAMQLFRVQCTFVVGNLGFHFLFGLVFIEVETLLFINFVAIIIM